MIKTGIYYAYWTSDWAADFVPFIGKVKELGFDLLEVNAGIISELNTAGRGELRRAAEDAGIEMSACIGLPPSSDLAAESCTIRKEGISHLNRIAGAMADCGIEKLSGIIYSSWPAKLAGYDMTKDKALENSIASMREAIRKAEDLNLVYNIEVVNRFEQFLINTAREAAAYIEAVGSRNLKMLLDTFHMNIEEDDMSSAVKTAGDFLGHVHLGENNRRPPGTGNYPWRELFETLREIGYDGSVVMEPFLHPGGEVGRDIGVYREIMPHADLDEEAEKSCRFIKDMINSVYRKAN